MWNPRRIRHIKMSRDLRNLILFWSPATAFWSINTNNWETIASESRPARRRYESSGRCSCSGSTPYPWTLEYLSLFSVYATLLPCQTCHLPLSTWHQPSTSGTTVWCPHNPFACNSCSCGLPPEYCSYFSVLGCFQDGCLVLWGDHSGWEGDESVQHTCPAFQYL